MPEILSIAEKALVQADQEVGGKWLESFNSLNISLGTFIGASFVSAIEYRFGIHFREQFITEGIGTVALAAASCVADNKSTMDCMDTCNAAEAMGVSAKFIEGNTIIGPVTKSEDYKKKHWPVDTFVMISSLIWPLGLGISAGKFIEALRNQRKNIKIRRTMKIVNSQSEA